MNFLFDNPLVRMPGTLFLLLYFVSILITAIVVKICKSNFDWTRKLPLPLIPQNPDPFEIAYLRGGENEFARSIIFALLQKGFLQISTEDKKSYIQLAQNQPNWATLSSLERNLLPWFQTTRETKEIFSSNGIIEILKPQAALYEQKITQSNFLTPKDASIKIKTLGFLAGGGIILSGAYKVFTSILSGHFNIGFTIIMAFISLIIFLKLAKPPRISNLGKRYVEKLQQAFENLKSKVQTPIGENSPVFGAVDPFLLAVGVFGVASLSGTMYHEYEQAFHRADTSNSGSSCGSGCGSSCSSGDSGGGCGGGCGGCS